MAELRVKKESVGEIAKVTKVVDCEEQKSELVVVYGTASCFRDGKLALGRNVMNGISQ